MKTCKYCKNSYNKDTLFKSKNMCKKCYSVRRKEYKDRKRPSKVVLLSQENKKQCSYCKIYKEKIEFGLDNKSIDKLSYSCKECLRTRGKKWVLENKEKVKKFKEKWKKNNKELMLIYERNKRKTDKNFQLKKNMRNRLWWSFKKFDTNSSIKYLDYTINDLKKHLESKFTNGMTWKNYGKNGWEIDHIIPIRFFNINGDHKSEAFKACWALSNLQPLWKTTKIAISYGENDAYIGNIDKNSQHVLTKEMQEILDKVNNGKT